ncbi:hypothetical protein OPV22_025494 [Ensete ventricosum]|uniref:Pectinesterase inhibitor domain-containing protein n=1 Tax=Ensete ventricosum TaxID=4639 RepID=A0AAV8P7J9_ENSVE|nr:hypothetical protein OPV22_025494 [Ensete ventricosum]
MHGRADAGPGACNYPRRERQGVNPRATRYPDLCFTSFSGYAAAVQLSRVAAVITLVRLRTLHSHVSTLRRATWLVAGALLDCTELLGDAAEPVSRTVEELERLESLEGSEAERRIANSLTWMSAAMADEETCSDYLQNTAEAGGSSVIADVDRQVGSLKEYTDNALALVDGR